MNTTAEVYLWGTRIGIIHQDINKPYSSFEYDKDFLRSGIELSPLRIPLCGAIYELCRGDHVKKHKSMYLISYGVLSRLLFVLIRSMSNSIPIQYRRV